MRNAVSDKCEEFTRLDIESDDGGLSAKTRGVRIGLA